MAHVADWKKEVVKKLEKVFKEYPIIAVVNMEQLPGAQLQKMRINLKDKVLIYMAKKRLIKIVLERIKGDLKGIEKLEESLKGIPALLFTKENPFKLYKLLQKSKSPAFAKPGQLAPRDIVIPAGPTPFGPGPMIGELGQMGVKSAIEGGKITIKQPFTAAKKGEPIPENICGLFQKMDIAPMEIGLNLVAAYEDGTVFGEDTLAIDEDKFIAQISDGARWAFNLAVEAGYFTKETVEVMLTKAARETRALAIEQGILTKDTASDVVAKANAQAASLKAELKL